ncbi:peptide ABC transporter substrate-binding protein [Plantactinospora sp. S1510]|uniref:Peptide ABC transporter substrate-binding protein n=1 Tax=Plantactinospora alkalitolerans TaxID=2789879 RepID=A0ABS0H9V4_9ACTN|nr:peptide ABC transporter substrate-binding protein [Plantactinospora alkalitolerans]MBF9135046.1 peptide ABC transporter substrate-binding protein [Plantactinospora alkalitolerans]
MRSRFHRRALRGTVAVASVLAIGAGLAACSGDSGSKGSQGGSQGKDTVTVAFRTPNWILPISAPGFTQGENATFTTALYRHLYEYQLDGSAKYNINAERSMAEAPVVSNGGKTLTITLKDNKWSDGKPVTTKDIQFWWNLVTANKDKWASYRAGGFPDNIADWKITDEKTFSLTTTKAYNTAWFVGNQLNRIVPLPQHIWDKDSATASVGDLASTPAGAKKVFDFLTTASKDPKSYATNELWKVTSGPWKLDKYVPNGEVVLAAQPTYSGSDKPKLAKIVLRPFTSDDAEFNVLRAGEIDYGYIPPANLSQQSYLESKDYKVAPWYGWSITYLQLNFNNPKTGVLFKQPYLRQAMQMLVDQPTINKVIWSGMAAPSCGPVPLKPGTTDANGCAYSFDPAKAKTLLEGHGWKVTPDGKTVCQAPGTAENQCGEGIAAGTPLAFTVTSQSGFDATTKMFSEIKSQMAKLGIELTIKEVPDSVAVTPACKPTEATCSWDMSFFGSQGSWYYPVFASGERLFSTGAPVNLGSYSNPEADRLIEATQFSADESALKAYNDFLAKDLPVLWMPNPVYQISAYKSGLQGVEPQDPMNYFYFQDWSWKN